MRQTDSQAERERSGAEAGQGREGKTDKLYTILRQMEEKRHWHVAWEFYFG